MKSEKTQAPRRLMDEGSADPQLGKLLAQATLAVESPSASARHRVWHGVQSRAAAPAPSGWARVAVGMGAGLAGAMAIAGVLWLRPVDSRSAIAQITQATGQVEIGTESRGAIGVAVGHDIEDGSRIRVAATARAQVQLSNASVVFEGGSVATFHRKQVGAGFEVRLAQGSLWANVKHRSGDEAFGVVVGDYKIRDIGTVFGVTTDQDGSISVRVEEGLVEVTGPSTEVRIGAKQAWAKGTGAQAAARTPVGVAPATTAAPAEATPVATDARSRTRRHVASAPPVASAAPVPAPVPAPASAPVPQAALPLAAPAIDVRISPAVEAQNQARAVTLVQEHRYAEAVQIYEVLASGGGGLAAASLYEVGRLKSHFLSDPSGGAEAFTRYAVQHPRGALRQEAALELIESLLADKSFAAASDAIAAFLRTYPTSARRDEVRLMRAHLLRAQSGCDAAVREYQGLVDVPNETGGDALYFGALCDHEIGRLDAGRDKLRRYLERHPRGRYRAKVQEALGE